MKFFQEKEKKPEILGRKNRKNFDFSVSEAQLFNIQSQISQVPTQCDSFSAHLVLRCVSPLIEYTRSSNHLGAPLPDPQLICQLYEEYLRCTPESIRRACAHFIRSVESVYDYVCSDEIQRNFTQSYRCLALQERTLVVANCERNTTEKFLNFFQIIF